MFLIRKKQFKITVNIISDMEVRCRKRRNFIIKENVNCVQEHAFIGLLGYRSAL
jgi:hypothetical protein